jgi:hypothetical protein
MSFSENLATLPSIDHLAALEILDGEHVIACIENKPGSAGSVRVYHALAQEFGALTNVAAQKGLQLYAEHTEDARAFPGKHPNIDRLFSLIETGQTWQIGFVVK